MTKQSSENPATPKSSTPIKAPKSHSLQNYRAKPSKDPRYQKSNKSILSAIIKSLRSRRTEDRRITKVCEQAKITKPAFYSHYPDFDHAVSSLEEDVFADFRAGMIRAGAFLKSPNKTPVLSPNPPESKVIIESFLACVLRNRQFFLTALTVNNTAVLSRMILAVRPTLQSGWISYGAANTHVLESLYVGEFIAVIYLWCAEDKLSFSSINRWGNLLISVDKTFLNSTIKRGLLQAKPPKPPKPSLWKH